MKTSKQDNSSFHVDLMFPSRYLKAVDLQEKPLSLTIEKIFRDQVRMTNGAVTEKYILRFKETEKQLVLNKTNAKAIAKLLREPKAVNWAGSVIVLKPTTCEAFGEIVDCIRVEMKQAS